MTSIQEACRAKIAEVFPPERYNTQGATLTLFKNTVGVKCPKCGSENVYVESKQKRAGDEAETKIYTCLTCKKIWKKN